MQGGFMSSIIKAAIIVAVAIVAGVTLYIYYSPYQTCVRAQTVLFEDQYQKPLEAAQINCSHP
jgi:hypothetical protein